MMLMKFSLKLLMVKWFDRETIQFGNCGIPIGGGRLRKKLNYTI
jgi:hypothetical protein